jgi:hypothetical protein
MQNNLVSVPLIFPKIVPTNWNEWWKFWFENAKYLNKVVNNHNGNSALWKGFDIYHKPGVNAELITKYNGKLFDCKNFFPDLYLNLNLLPIDVSVIKVVSCLAPIYPHSDSDPLEKDFIIRTLLYDNNVFDNFYYLINNQKIYLKLPKETNTWGYFDYQAKHGVDFYFGHSKILFMYHGKIKKDFNIDASITRYRDYLIYNNE